ncbi:MAG: hypothetical protein ABII13_05595 [Patescibacteria group bacterium]|nr:hypothetical protein [Patescibacteria group bacterium]
MSEIVVDYCENIVFDSEKIMLHEAQSLWDLRIGLHFLAQQVRAFEIEYAKNHSDITAACVGIPGLEPQQLSLLTCMFHWFANMLVNHARLCGYMRGVLTHKIEPREISKNKTKVFCNEYVKSCVPEELRIWRHKVAAHFAITDPRSGDGIANTDFSVTPQLAWQRPYFMVAGFRMKSHIDNSESTLKPWKLTEIFERLAYRWWPDVNLPELKLTK